jgi:hypothetical protein
LQRLERLAVIFENERFTVGRTERAAVLRCVGCGIVALSHGPKLKVYKNARVVRYHRQETFAALAERGFLVPD